MIHDLRFMDHALSHWFSAISESQSEVTLLEIALADRVHLATRVCLKTKGISVQPDSVRVENALRHGLINMFLVIAFPPIATYLVHLKL